VHVGEDAAQDAFDLGRVQQQLLLAGAGPVDVARRPDALVDEAVALLNPRCGGNSSAVRSTAVPMARYWYAILPNPGDMCTCVYFRMGRSKNWHTAYKKWKSISSLIRRKNRLPRTVNDYTVAGNN
jgi:hypothetical protein